ncbi:hypothetical protein BaRGS_00009229 [Batillaria attramentaria]|uniref:Uncharacterized protein n=1 Tax=Batillaria attramentaria TaxID=370345 RepID=A0ABD0LJ71_9CAEN
MKLQLLFCALLAVATCSFVEFLDSLQNHHSFQRLSQEEKLLFSELVLSAEEGTVSDFIDRVGLGSVIKLMDHMSSYDAQKFEAYLAEPSNQDVVSRRQLDRLYELGDYLRQHHLRYFDHLPQPERQTYHDLMEASDNGNLTDYIHQVGYGPIFGLLEHLDYTHSNEVYHLLERQLASEASVEKRDEHHEFRDYLSGLQSQYYQHLEDPEKATFNGLLDAATTGDVTGYIDSIGYGPIFGLLEHLDYTHSNQIYHFIEQVSSA